MLRSILVSLTAESPSLILGPLGRPVQAWFLGLLARSDASLASRLHDAQGPKPYTVSTLLDDRALPLSAGRLLESGQTCFLRLTSLNEELSEVFEKKIIHHPPTQLALYKMNFRVNGVLAKQIEHEWAGEASFTEIAQDNISAETGNIVRMEFASPTAFRIKGVDVIIPSPSHIFRSLWEKWNAFAPEAMKVHELWPQFANDCIVVNQLTSLNTANWELSEGARGAVTGFTGIIGYKLLPRNKVEPAWREYWDGASVVLKSLADFAIYSGVGHHVTIGMGQARALPGKLLQRQ